MNFCLQSPKRSHEKYVHNSTNIRPTCSEEQYSRQKLRLCLVRSLALSVQVRLYIPCQNTASPVTARRPRSDGTAIQRVNTISVLPPMSSHEASQEETLKIVLLAVAKFDVPSRQVDQYVSAFCCSTVVTWDCSVFAGGILLAELGGTTSSKKSTIPLEISYKAPNTISSPASTLAMIASSFLNFSTWHLTLATTDSRSLARLSYTMLRQSSSRPLLLPSPHRRTRDT